MYFGSFFLAWINNSTELLPDHTPSLELVFWVAGGLAVVGFAINWRATTDWPRFNRIGFSIAIAFLSFLSALFAFGETREIILGKIDFPKHKTRKFIALLPIDRAYRTHPSKSGPGWIIQPTPFWTNIDITEDDWNYMVARRRPWDDGSDPDDISSKGYFCAKVELEQAEGALRVVYSGNFRIGKMEYLLPSGSISACPLQSVDVPYFVVNQTPA